MGKLIINKAEKLNQLNKIINNEKFDLTDIRYNKSYKILEIPYQRIFHEGPSRIIKNWIIRKVVEVDILQCLLKIKNVEKYEIADKADIGVYSFNKLIFDEKSKQLIFACNEPCELRLEVSGIHIENEELEYRGKARITRGLFCSCNAIEVSD